MARTTHERLCDISDSIGQIGYLLNGRSFEWLSGDRIAMAASERYLEIISEASRHVPDDLKQRRPEISSRRVADIGNWLRHAYDSGTRSSCGRSTSKISSRSKRRSPLSSQK